MEYNFFSNRPFLAFYARIRIFNLFIISFLFPSNNRINLKKNKRSSSVVNQKIARRIFESYKKMKINQKKNIFSPYHLW